MPGLRTKGSPRLPLMITLANDIRNTCYNIFKLTAIMTEYKLNIKIDQNMVKKFKASGLRLCLGFGFDTTARPGSTKFNVIGYSSGTSLNGNSPSYLG